MGCAASSALPATAGGTSFPHGAQIGVGRAELGPELWLQCHAAEEEQGLIAALTRQLETAKTRPKQAPATLASALLICPCLTERQLGEIASTACTRPSALLIDLEQAADAAYCGRAMLLPIYLAPDGLRRWRPQLGDFPEGPHAGGLGRSVRMTMAAVMAAAGIDVDPSSEASIVTAARQMEAGLRQQRRAVRRLVGGGDADADGYRAGSFSDSAKPASVSDRDTTYGADSLTGSGASYGVAASRSRSRSDSRSERLPRAGTASAAASGGIATDSARAMDAYVERNRTRRGSRSQTIPATPSTATRARAELFGTTPRADFDGARSGPLAFRGGDSSSDQDAPGAPPSMATPRGPGGSTTGRGALMRSSSGDDLLGTKRTIRDKYTLGRTLGRGAFAVVKLGVEKATGVEYAVKIIRLPQEETGATGAESFGPAQRGARAEPGVHAAASGPSRFSMDGAEVETTVRSDIIQEIQIMLALSHPSVIHLKEFFVEGSYAYLVTELLNGGELLDALVQRGSYTEAECRSIMLTLLQGVAYLHNHGVVHRDLRLENLLLQRQGDISGVKIADFGLAARAAARGGALNTVCGCPQYIAPEVVTYRTEDNPLQYSSSCDVWSCGVILFILLAGYPPFYATHEAELFRKIREEEPNYAFDAALWTTVSLDGQELVEWMLCKDPARRPSAKDVLGHRWFSSPDVDTGPVRSSVAFERCRPARPDSVTWGDVSLRADEHPAI